MNYVIVLGKELKPGDTIIHNYCKFKITECGIGRFAGSMDGFGEYYWVIGNFKSKVKIKGNRDSYSRIYGQEEKVDFWTFQECPIIKCIEN